MTRCSLRSFAILLTFALLTTFSFSQEKFEREHEKKDNPAAFQQWFMKSRTPRNTKESPASLLQKATRQKMELRAEHLRQLQMARQAGKRLAGISTTNNVWTSLGPSPIVWGNDATQSWTGRITTVAVDQTDTTGNTVVVGGAYGGVWRSTNAADPTPANIVWTSLTDDQSTLSIGAIAIQPLNGSTIIAGTGEPNGALDSYYGQGILTSTDTGAHWTLNSQTIDVTPVSFFGKAISGIAFDSRPGSTSNVVAGIASAEYPGSDDGVRGAVYSSDAGATWHASKISDGSTQITDSSVMAVVYNPAENKFFITVRHHGVFVSTDQGHTFTRLSTQPNASVLTETNCGVPTNGNCPLYRAAMAVRYVAPGHESGAQDEMYIWMIGIDPNTGNTTDLNIYQTKNGGGSWTQLSETGINASTGGDASGVDQAWYDVYLGAVPNGSNTDLFAATINIYKCSISSSNPTCTANPFINLTHVYDQTCNADYPNVHPDEHGFDYVGANPKITFFGNDGGMYRSLDETKLTNGNCTALNVFDSMNATLGSLSQFIWGSHSQTKPSELMGGTQDNGTMYVDNTLGVPGTNGWYEVLGGDGGYNAIDSHDNWYGSNTGVTIQNCPGGYSGCRAIGFNWPNLVIDGYTGFSQVDGDSNDTAFYTPFILDPQDDTKLIIGTCRIWRGATTASAWPNDSIKNALSHKFFSTSDASCGNDASDVIVSAIAAGGPLTSSGSQVIYAGTSFGASTGGAVFVTKSAGAPGSAPTSWTNVTGSINPIGYQVNGIAVDPHDATGATAVAVIQGFTGGPGKVWRTTNFGASWTDISGNIPDAPANDVVVDPDDAKTIYVATDVGVYVTTDLTTWSEVGPNTIGASGFLPNSTVFHIAIYENGADKRLRAWTHGRGAWETILPTAQLTVSATHLSFSTQVNTTSSVQTITLTNNSSSAFSVGTPALSGSGAASFQIAALPSPCTTSLAANSSCQIGVQFAPTASGSFSATLSVPNGSSNNPTVTVALAGTATTPAATDFAFDFGSNPTSATVAPGGTATYNFNIDATPSGDTFNPAITFACTGMPTGATCSAPSVTSAGAVTLTINVPTTASAHRGGPLAKNTHLGGVLTLALAIPGLAFFVPAISTRARRKRMLLYLGTLMLAMAFITMSACGGGGSSSSGGGGGGTQSTTYKVVVTGTYGSTTHTQNLTLIVN